MIVPLHNHTHYSALDGLSTPKQIAERVKGLGLEAVACTDHDVVAGHIDFYKTLSEEDIKPILGIETYQTPKARQVNFGFRTDKESGEKADNFHLILFAKDNTGLRNLYSLVTEAHATGFYYNARTDWELLAKYSEGLIATSACGLGMIQQAVRGNSYAGDPEVLLKRYLDIFGDNFYLELSTYPEDFQYDANLATVSLGKTYGVPFVYANDAHYASPDQYPLHEVTLCMQYQQKVKDQTEPHHKQALYIMGESEVRSHMDYLPRSIVDEAIDNSVAIAKQCDVTLPEFRQRVPVFIPDNGYKTGRDMLFDLCVKGYEEKIASRGLDDDLYLERFEKEMDIFFKAGLVDYFLMVRDFIQAAKKEGYLVGPGRGSVGGSLLAYLLDITQVDPIHYGLIFERFYNAGRETSLPDIDTDFPTFGREFVKSYLAEKYGHDYVADIGTTLAMQGKSAIQKVGTALSINRRDTEAISKLIDRAIESGLQPTWEMIYKAAGDELEPYKASYPPLFEYAEGLYEHNFGYGVHASGFLIADEPLRETFPLRWHAKEKKLVTQWDMRVAEKLGFMKVDLLGLRNLDTLMEVNKILVETGRDPISFHENMQYEEHPEDMWKMLEKGWTIGLFQIEDGGTAKRLAKEIAPRNVDDLGVIVALNRPGPLIANADKRYVSGRNGNMITYINDLVARVTQETYGEFIYQEQVINYFRELGYTLQEADNMRSIIGKKKREAMQAAKPEYLRRSKAAGVDEGTAEHIWELIENFSKYAFNKSHSVQYGIILLWTLYAKYYYPREFILAGLRTVDKVDNHKWIAEAQRMGIEILHPELNWSDVHAKIEDNAIRFGYADVKGVGLGPAKWLVKHAPFKDWDEVIEKAQLDEYKYTLPNGQRRMAINRGQVDALKRFSTIVLDPDAMLEAEEELLGMALSDPTAKILEDHADEIARDCTPLEELKGPGEFTIAGVIKEVKQTKTRKGAPMAWVKVENSGIELDIAVWNTELDRLKFIWRRRTALVAQVKVTEDNFVSLVSARVLYGKKEMTHV